MLSPLQGYEGPMPHSHPRNRQAELGLKQMLNWCVERDGQQQHNQCPDAGGGRWVCRDQGMAWIEAKGAAVAGEVRYEWAARGKEMGVEVGGARWPAGPRGLSPSPQA